MNKTTHRAAGITLIMSAIAMPAVTCHALKPDYYAQESALASGRWAKIKVAKSGINLITTAQLRNLGFNDPEKVHVYGLGGRQLDEGLTSSHPDDLPVIPSQLTSKGILFFATDNFSWSRNSSTSSTPYTHKIHQFSDDTFYFISDIEIEEPTVSQAATSAAKAAKSADTFIERIVHESELEPAGESGSQIWGEDFRSRNSQTFQFTMPSIANDTVTLCVRFGAKTTSGTSNLALTANGSALDNGNDCQISASEAKDVGRLAVITRKAVAQEGKLNLGLDYTYSGTLYSARLDNIELFYKRRIALSDGQLHFYIDSRPGEGVSVEGCSANTVIWDITNPLKPAKVEFALDGSSAHFTTNTYGAREYVAFEPETAGFTTTNAGSVANQNLHALETPDLLIISPTEYMEAAEKIADVHRTHDGMRVHVLTPEVIYNEFSGGKPDLGAFRRLLKMWYDRGRDADGHKIGYALIMGKGTNDAKLVGSATKQLSYTPMRMWETTTGYQESNSYPNDSWLGMLADVQSAAFTMEKARFHVAVGRIPCKSPAEAMNMANKIEKYVANPEFGSWRNKVMVIADSRDAGIHYKQAQNVYNAMRSTDNGKSRQYDRVYVETYPLVMTATGMRYPQASEKILSNYDEGVAIVNYTGHANETGWGHQKVWEWKDIKSMTNKHHPLMYAATCDFAKWDTPSVSGAETILLNPDGGMIGIIAATRQVYIANNGELNEYSSFPLFARDEKGGLLRWGDIFVRGQNFNLDIDTPKNESNRLRYALLGDPAIRIPGGEHKVTVTEINGVDVTGGARPELSPQSQAAVSGVVCGLDGEIDTDFNGTVNVQLYDGETVFEFISQNDGGNPSDPLIYNDHNKRLFTTTAKVTGGHWSATLNIPPEIQGLYNNALLSCYAWSDDGREGGGAFTDFYVYGYSNDTDDTEGPRIDNFYVNNPSLPEDAIVYSNMVVFATLTDESGINMSDTGIGHSLQIAIDNNEPQVITPSYLEQDADNPSVGYLTYPLNNVEAGHHTLTLTAWDNANNMSRASIDIEVGSAKDPEIIDISADKSTATAGVEFKITIDRPNSDMLCNVAVFNLNGRRIWEYEETVNTGLHSLITTNWNLCDMGGNRVPRGIYIYRATVESQDGMYTSKSKKLAVSAADEGE